MNPTETDSALLPYLQAADEEAAQSSAARLMIEQAEPLINGIVARQLGASLRQNEVADVRGEIVLQLLQRLRSLRDDTAATPIADFRAYVAGVSYRGCALYLRQQYPLRWRLRNRVQYLLTHQPQFCLWQEAEAEWIGGLASWEGTLSHRSLLSSARIYQLLDHALPQQLCDLPDATCKRVSAAEQVAAIFRWAEQFIALDDLVAILAHWWGVKDQWHDDEVAAQGEKADPLNVETQVEQRIQLQKLWQEIKALPVRQRQALLLHLRSKQSWELLALFPALQIASLRQLAAVLAMPAEELAALWNKLPLADTEIAARLNVTRRQVINLRKTARERLMRKMRDW